MDVEARLRELGHELPQSPPTPSNYRRHKLVGNLLFLAAHGPWRDGKRAYVGKVGRELTKEQAYDAARIVALNHLASAKEALGDLSRIKGVVKVTGAINVAPGFDELPAVMNGISDLYVAIWGDEGVHTRAVWGAAEMPGGFPLEIDAIFEVDPKAASL
ncbi:MAG: RidA family protein [Chloroflexi bacterium]|nr:RidA family protein [Chloroflexota bacterium]